MGPASAAAGAMELAGAAVAGLAGTRKAVSHNAACAETQREIVGASQAGLIQHSRMYVSVRLERKLFIHNTGHATCAYWALRKGCRFVHEGARDPQIIEQVRLAIGQSGSAVAAEHGFARDNN